MAEIYGDVRLPQRFWDKTHPEPNTGCWLWSGSLRSGYGCIKIDGKGVSTHRTTYEIFVSQIPEGLHIDHLCRNRACCNPAHLEPVTSAENIRRGAAAITHCPKKHEYNEDNTYRDKYGTRFCKTCRRAQDLRRNQTPERRAAEKKRHALRYQAKKARMRDAELSA